MTKKKIFLRRNENLLLKGHFKIWSTFFLRPPNSAQSLRSCPGSRSLRLWPRV